MADILVIGYGNESRRDVGIGPRVAETISAKNYPSVRLVTCFQLVAELAVDIAESRLVIFVDALANPEGTGVESRRITTESVIDWSTHTGDRKALLALTHAVYRRAPEAWWVMVPGEDFGFGKGLSAVGKEITFKAIDRIGMLIRRNKDVAKVSSKFNPSNLL